MPGPGYALFILPLTVVATYAQTAPPVPERAYSVMPDARLREEIAANPAGRPEMKPDVTYSLADLVDIAERNNPETRAIWERAKQRAAALGVSRSALYPAVAAIAAASVNQYSLFFGKFYHEDTTLFPASLHASWTVLDFGARQAAIDLAKANLLAADFTFNDTHRRVIFDVAEAYYRLIEAMSQEEAAQATLSDARTVQDAIEAKLANGLATLPDALEARAATAQAQYELASIQGLVDASRGALSTVLGISPAVSYKVQNVTAEAIPETIAEPFETIVKRALAQRPDLLAQAARVRVAEAGVSAARAAWYPALSFSGDWGHTNAIGQEKGDPITAHSAMYPYQAQVKLTWEVFDGGARRNESARAAAAKREAQAQVAASRDRIENEIWASYVQLKTARSQQQAADALMVAADRSYTAAMESFQAGVRTFIDVTTAQRELARARTAQVDARAQLLLSIADLAFRAGDPIQAAQH